jgi:tRNA-specific 2-thiouridylase
MNRSVLVAMSGGVDSSVAAFLLRDAGYEVSGVTMRLTGAVTSGDAAPPRDEHVSLPMSHAADAAQVSALLGIPHEIVDLRGPFHEKVVSYFFEEYERGRTPNPCVRCNKVIKFGFLLRLAKERGIPHIATGHYARVERDPSTRLYRLLRGSDRAKDQSYFLYTLNQNQLRRVLMPLGGFTKTEVREIARRTGLPVSEKAESQEICFIPGNDYRAFFESSHFCGRPRKGASRGGAPVGSAPGEGPILDGSGKVVGRHAGLARYTIGQRRGLGIASHVPLYVARIDGETGAITVAPKEGLFHNRLTARPVSWIEGPARPAATGSRTDQSFRVTAKIRSLHTAAPALITPLGGGAIELRFDEPQWAITPGQSVVFYQGDTVLGGGIITRGWRE